MKWLAFLFILFLSHPLRADSTTVFIFDPSDPSSTIILAGSFQDSTIDLTANYYVDAQNGNDSYPGTTALFPKKTYSAAEALVDTTTDTIFVTGTFDNPFSITKSCGLVLNAVFYSQGLTDYTYVPGAAGGSVIDTFYSAANSDDIMIGYGNAYDYAYLNFGHIVTSYNSGMRFTGVTERSGYDSAKIRLTAQSDVSSANTYKLRIVGEDNATPSTFSTAADFNTRAADSTSNNYVYHNTTTWSTNNYYDFRVDNIIDDLFTSYNYSSGNIVLFVLDNGTASNEGRSAYSYNYGGAYVPKLVVFSSGTASNAYYWKIVSDSVLNVYFGSEAGNTEKADKSLLAAAKDWCYNNDTLYVYGEALPPTPSGESWYYVSTDSSRKTIAHVNAMNADTLVPGDTVAFNGVETFNDAQLVVKSGVTYISYGTGRATLTKSSETSTEAVIKTYGTTGVTLKDFDIIGRYWVDGHEGDGYTTLLTVNNCDFAYPDNTDADKSCPSSPGPFDMVNGRYIKVIKSIYTGNFANDAFIDLLNFTSADYVFIDSCIFKNTQHVLAMTDKADHVRVRGNRFYNLWHSGMNLSTSSSNNFLIEYNYFERSGIGYRSYPGDPNPPDNEGGSLYMWFSDAIYRNNVIRKQGASGQYWSYDYAGSSNSLSLPALGMSSGDTDWYGDYVEATNQRVYNNTIDLNYGFGLWFGIDYTFTYDNNKIFNNSITRSGDATYKRSGSLAGTDSVSVVLSLNTVSGNPNGNEFTYNYLPAVDNCVYYQTSNTLYSANELTGNSWWNFNNNQSKYFNYQAFDNWISDGDSLNVASTWTDGDNANLNMQDSLRARYNPKAPLIGTGRPPAYVSPTGGTTSNQIVVTDPYVFHDGWNWLEGDSIFVNNQRVQIESINYSTSTLTLSGSVTVNNSDPIYIINPYTHEPYTDPSGVVNIGYKTY